MAVSDPLEWIRAYVKIQQKTDAQILALINVARRDIARQINALALRGKVSDLVRIEQLKLVQRNIMREQAEIFRKLGDIIRARRVEAASRAIELGSALDDALLTAAGRGVDARTLRAALSAGPEQTMNTALVRMGLSAVPLSQKIYSTQVWMGGRIQTLVNSAILRGLSAREFAKEATAWFDPSVPGGVRYAALRLARTELNNAFHATTALQAAEKPWINEVQWHLSRSHPKADECDALAKGGDDGDGRYPPLKTPRKPHPQCLCYVTPVPVEEDEFLDNLVAGRYDDYLDRVLARGSSRL